MCASPTTRLGALTKRGEGLLLVRDTGPRGCGRISVRRRNKETPTNKQYNHTHCQSLFGYAQKVHKRSRAICQLCDCGTGQQVNFDLWRQMTVEHLIGESQGGYLKGIRAAIAERFPELSSEEHERLAQRIDEANTVTACRFCNSTTSRNYHSKGMTLLIKETGGTPDEAVNAIEVELKKVLESKRADVRWKLKSVREAFVKTIEPELAGR